MDLSFEAPYYTFIKYENIETIEIYDKFLNWIMGEFELFQMEEFEGLKVFYPNGWFFIGVLQEAELDLKLEIKIKSKTINSGIQIESKIYKIYSHLIQFYENRDININVLVQND